ncbi:aspartic peptidase domain-containing protein [Schizophyllum commune]
MIGKRPRAEEDAALRRQRQRRDEHEVLLELETFQNGEYDVSYALNIGVGEPAQSLSVQVDTGSSDMWVVGANCDSGPCHDAGAHYDASTSKTMQGSGGTPFSIAYLQGSVAGEIVYDAVRFGDDDGGFVIPAQAFAAASMVDNEPLAHNFDGVLGLAFSANSIIRQQVPAPEEEDADDPNAESVSYNLFRIDNPPASAFISLLLERPGSDRYPSMMGIGAHPSQKSLRLSQSPVDALHFLNLVSSTSGPLLFNVLLTDVTAHPSTIDGHANELTEDQSLLATPLRAILDSGVPLILTRPDVANAIYGSVGVGPGADGLYYIPCATPLNLTFTLADTSTGVKVQIPVHPVDLSLDTIGESGANSGGGGRCTGAIQATTNMGSGTAASSVDIVLGTPFMRNVYSVMAYRNPSTFDNQTATTSDDGDDDEKDDRRRSLRRAATPSPIPSPRRRRRTVAEPSVVDSEDPFRTYLDRYSRINYPPSSPIPLNLNHTYPRAFDDDTPYLGLVPLTDYVWAAEEFEAVRINGLAYPKADGTMNTKESSSSAKGLSTGLKVLIACLAFFFVCFGLFALRFFYVRRRDRKLAPTIVRHGDINGFGSADKKSASNVQPVKHLPFLGIFRRRRRKEADSGDYELASLHDEPKSAVPKRMVSEYSDFSIPSAHTLVGEGTGKGKYEAVSSDERDVLWDAGTGLDWHGSHRHTGSSSTDGDIPPLPPAKHRPLSLELEAERARPRSSEGTPGLGEFGELASPPLLAATPEERRARLREAYFNPPDRSSMFDSNQPTVTSSTITGPYPLLDPSHARAPSASSTLVPGQRESVHSARGSSPQPPPPVFSGSRPRSASRQRHVKMQDTMGSRASFFPYQQAEPWAAAAGADDDDDTDEVEEFAPPSPEERRGRRGHTPRQRSSDIQFEYFGPNDLPVPSRSGHSHGSESETAVPRGAASPIPPPLATPDLRERTPDLLDVTLPSSPPLSYGSSPHSWLPEISHVPITLEPILDVRSEENSAESGAGTGARDAIVESPVSATSLTAVGSASGVATSTQHGPAAEHFDGLSSPSGTSPSQARNTTLPSRPRPRGPSGPRRIPSNGSARSFSASLNSPH